MAKKNAGSLPVMDIEDFALFVTVLLHCVNPAIDQRASYDLVLDLLAQDVDEDLTSHYGALIWATALTETDSH